MKFLKKIFRSEAPAVLPAQELFPPGEQQQTADNEAELVAAFEELYRTSFARRRKSVLDVFSEAAKYSPLPGPARETLSAAFAEAVAEISRGPELFTEAFETSADLAAFVQETGSRLRAVAQNSKIRELRLMALGGMAATIFINPGRLTQDLSLLMGLARNDEDPAIRAGATKALSTVASSNNISPLSRVIVGSFVAAYDVRSFDTFRRIDFTSYAEYQECIMGAAACILRTDPAPEVREAAAQLLRDVAASNPPKYQFLAASYGNENRLHQHDKGVLAVIQGILDDAKVVNFPQHQRIPGVTA